jgi:hypothetical protein
MFIWSQILIYRPTSDTREGNLLQQHEEQAEHDEQNDKAYRDNVDKPQPVNERNIVDCKCR